MTQTNVKILIVTQQTISNNLRDELSARQKTYTWFKRGDRELILN